MASSSSSTSHKRKEEFGAFSGIEPPLIEPPFIRRKVGETSRSYDVFINHRGPDVKRTLAVQLYKSLKKLNITAFLDSEEKELGISFPSTIEAAIRSAAVHIAIFSKGYAESPWCLTELDLMLRSKAKIIPVFYDVKPSDLRYIENGQYADAFNRYREKSRYLDKLEQWKEALQCISFSTGYESCSDFNDYENIVSAVQKEVERKNSLLVAKHPVGLHGLVKDFERLCLDRLVEDFERQRLTNEGSKNKSHIVGIFGMGGVGKTTLAKELFNRKQSQYSRACFLFDVREADAINSFPSLQMKLIKDAFQEDQFNLQSKEEGKTHITDCIERSNQLSFLIVLDDIDHVQQLDALPIMEMLEKSVGSLVIVTTRDAGVLINAGITAGYHLKGMGRTDARELFCWHAFGQPYPATGYENLVNSFLNACRGLPLSLQILGAHVRGRDQNYWSLELDKVSKTLPRDIYQRLKISFDSLDYEEQQIFMDIACFFVENLKSIAMEVWKASGCSAIHALETLKNKCLVEEIEEGFYGVPEGKEKIKIEEADWAKLGKEKSKLCMHDHLRLLGREMAVTMKRPRRLWRPQYLKYLAPVQLKELSINSDAEAVDSIMEENELRMTFESLSDHLEWLCWNGFPLRNLPSWLTLRNLRVLELHGANELEELWVEKAHAPLQLRELIISGTWSASFERFPSSISNLNHLSKIALSGDVGKEFGIKCLPEEFCDLQSLEHLELRHCTMLSSLPARFGGLRNLRHLDLCSCKGLRLLPDSFKKLTQLQYLDLSGCKKLALQIDILENITELKNLNLSGCHKLRQLPHQITDQACLRILRLEDTRLEGLPTNIGRLSKLELLTIGSPFLTSLPVSLGDLSSLKSLSIIDCIDLESLPETFGRLSLLEYLCIESSELRSLPEGFTELTNLKKLEISGCPLGELDFGSGSSSALCNLRVIKITETCVSRISITKGCCPNLETLDISRNDCLEEIAMSSDHFQDG